MHNTVKSAEYIPAAHRTDTFDHVIGDVTYVRFNECEHLMLGVAHVHYKVGSRMKCWKCERDYKHYGTP